MTDQEHINARIQLSRLLASRKILKVMITPGSSVVITEEEFKAVDEILDRWQDELFELVKIK